MPRHRRRDNHSETEEVTRILPKRSHICPICSISLPVTELAAHYSHERNLLSSPQPTNKRPAAVLALAKITDRPRLSKRNEVSSLLSRVRANRDSRRNNQVIDDHDGGAEECPVCGLCLMGTGISVEEHISACLDDRIQDEQQSQGDGWNVYEVGGQTRVRAMGLLEGGVQSIPNAVIHTDVDEEMDVFVDVEGDAEIIYGRTQYTEADLDNLSELPSTTKPPGRDPSYFVLMVDLRCNICLNPYCTPVVSVQCFHTFCEKCWLQALQLRKLCPQCRIITQPADLRRVYL